MKAYKCDRCEALYEHYEHEVKGHSVNKILLTKVGDMFMGFHSEAVGADLCPACLRELLRWMRAGEFESAPDAPAEPYAFVATGIIRRVDELGRIMIPKEIRAKVGAKEGDPFEIYVTEGAEVVLRKYVGEEAGA